MRLHDQSRSASDDCPKRQLLELILNPVHGVTFLRFQQGSEDEQTCGKTDCLTDFVTSEVFAMKDRQLVAVLVRQPSNPKHGKLGAVGRDQAIGQIESEDGRVAICALEMFQDKVFLFSEGNCIAESPEYRLVQTRGLLSGVIFRKEGEGTSVC